MKETLVAVRNKLRTDITYIADVDIFITPDVDMIPVSCGFPAIAIKDGGIIRTEEINNLWEEKLSVVIVVLQLMKDADISVVGQASPLIRGVLDIVTDIHTVLNYELLSITGMIAALPMNELQSETIGTEDIVLQRKIIEYEYTKEVTQL